MTVLDVATAYRLWAPTYSAENAVSLIEDGLVRRLTPALADKRLLDVGCGTGRRLATAKAERATGVDQSLEMLAVARSVCGESATLVHGDLLALPLPDATAEVTWCRLVIGHVADLQRAYDELARVTAPGGSVIVTDFHPDADAAGHRRTFRAAGETHEVEHYRHSIDSHLAAAAAAGLRIKAVRHGAIGDDVEHFYVAAGRGASFERDAGLNVVLALQFRRSGPCAR